MLVAVDPYLIGAESMILTEAWFTFALVAFTLFALTYWRSGPLVWACLGGFLGYLVLIRGTMIAFPLVLLPVAIVAARALGGGGGKNIVAFVACFALVYAPWVIRNYVVFHAVVPVRVGGGDIIWSGNYLPWDGDWRGVVSPLPELRDGLDPIEGDRVMLRETVRNIAANPSAYPLLYARKIPKFWLGVPGGDRLLRDHPTLLRALRAAWTAVLVAMMFGIAMSYHCWRRGWLLLTLMGYFTVIHMPMVALPRYRVPIHPIVYMFVAAGVMKMWDAWSARRRAWASHV
jgi:hypothetical protein